MLGTHDTRKNNLVSFYSHVASLKDISCTRWVKRGIPNPESVSDYTYSMLMLFDFLVQRRELKHDEASDKICRDMIRYHDIRESLIGDIAPLDGIFKGIVTSLSNIYLING